MKALEFKKIRSHLEFTQEQMADLIGLSGFQAVSNIESGRRNPNKLAAAFLRLLYHLPDHKAQELMGLMRKHMEK